MKRRDYLKLTALAAGAALTNPLVLASTTESTSQRRFGLQLFTVREKLVQDPLNTLAEIASMGYREIEMFGLGGNPFIEDPLFGLSAKELRKRLDDYGLSVPSTTISGRMMDIPAYAELAHDLGIQYFIVAMAPEFITITDAKVDVTGVSGTDQIKIISERLNQQARMCRENGLTLAYHNHHMEFTPLAELDGMLAYDYMMQLADPELVKIEFDIGWLTGAKVDPVKYLVRYGQRVIATHLKDFNPELPIGQDLKRAPIPIMTQMTEAGTGIVDFKQVLAVMDQIGIEHGFVEIDLTDTPMESVQRSLDYLKTITG